jgi:hypothetical protein
MKFCYTPPEVPQASPNQTIGGFAPLAIILIPLVIYLKQRENNVQERSHKTP